MKFTPADVPDVIVIEPEVYGDERGFFMESWRRDRFTEAGIDVDFVQENVSRSAQGVLRGLHYQMRSPQGKLVRVVRGTVFDVAVDMRQRSPTFGRWTGTYLSDENKCQVWVPPGFAHGFLVVSDSADLVYKCTEAYAPAEERILLWNDPQTAIDWPVGDIVELLLSDKDAKGLEFGKAEYYP